MPRIDLPSAGQVSLGSSRANLYLVIVGVSFVFLISFALTGTSAPGSFPNSSAFSFVRYRTLGLYGDLPFSSSSISCPLNGSPSFTNLAPVILNLTASFVFAISFAASLPTNTSVSPVTYKTSPVSKFGTHIPALGVVIRLPRVWYRGCCHCILATPAHSA